MVEQGKQAKVGKPDLQKKSKIDEEIVGKIRQVQVIDGQRSKTKEALKKAVEKKEEKSPEKKAQADLKIVGLLLKSSSLDNERNNVSKALSTLIKKRVELFGNEDMPTMSEILKQLESEGEVKKDKNEDEKEEE